MHAPLVEVVRGDLVESVHFGSLVLLAADGRVELSIGDVDSAMFPRSANKLMQAAGVLELGVDLRGEQLAIAASSHSGGEPHVAAVRALLADYGVAESALQNTPGLPIGAAERKAFLSAGGQKSSLRADCSGKHASFLAACVQQGWNLADYRSADHPLQRHLAEAMAKATATPIQHTSVDGCGAPLWSSSLVGLARAYRLGASGPSDSALRRVGDAMSAYPELVGGPGREPTAAMRALPGLVAKDGAEGVFAMGLSDGRAAAIKIADGSKRGLAPVILAILRRWGATEAALADFPQVPVLGWGQPVGRLRLAPGLEGLSARGR